jgi:Fe-coproporphyrin III synthase
MDLSVITTYRCSSRCSMCNVWRYPTLPDDEVSLVTLEKLPHNFDYLNLTGGEPTLRRDLMETVSLLYPKAKTFEISSNGLHTERLEPIIREYPNVKIRLSLEGLEATNNRIRGEKDGYAKKVRGLLRLQDLGGTDLGFAITIQDDNCTELVDLFRFAEDHCFELSTSTLHNGFQFHKADNEPYDRIRVAKQVEGLILDQLRTRKVKNWFRAYLNLGLVAKILGQDRLLRCTAGTNFAFVDPWSDVYACNVRTDLKMGNLEAQGWGEIVEGEEATRVRQKVSECTQNCWMVGSAKTSMRHARFTKLPRLSPLLWVLENKLRVTFGLQVNFAKYVNYSQVHSDSKVTPRFSNLDSCVERRLQTRADRLYDSASEFTNR